MNGNKKSDVFDWLPLPQRRDVLSPMNKTKFHPNTSEPLYPQTDETLWLRSCENEILIPLEGKVTGVIPQWVSGSLIRNGPGSIKVGSAEFNHLFDSSAHLHKFTIKDGRVSYQCRFLQSEAYKKNKEADRIVVSEFGTRNAPDPCRTIFERISSLFYSDLSDNANISVYPFGDELYAFNETPIVHNINTETLDTTNRVNVREYVSILHHTSHPHVMEDGTVYNLALTMYPTGPYYTIVCYPANKIEQDNEMFKKAHIVASVPARWLLNPSYMHTFGITKNYFIIVEQPLSISFTGAAVAVWKNEPPATCLKWYHDEYTKINVLSRKTGKLCQVFYAEAFFYLHIIHQYEKENHIVLDICAYKDPSVLNAMYTDAIKTMKYNPDYAKMFRSRPVRFVLPMETHLNNKNDRNCVTLEKTEATAHYLENGSIMVTPEKICNIGCETPRINYDYLGKPYRYFYAMGSDVDSDKSGCIIKVDTHNKCTKIWWEENCYASEPIFIPSPNSQCEDDGVILSSLLYKADVNHVGLLVLNAKTFKELGRAEFHTPGPVPKCLHGWFLPQK